MTRKLKVVILVAQEHLCMVPGLGQIAILGLMDRRRCAGGGRKISDAGSGSIRGASPEIRSGFAHGKAGQSQT